MVPTKKTQNLKRCFNKTVIDHEEHLRYDYIFLGMEPIVHITSGPWTWSDTSVRKRDVFLGHVIQNGNRGEMSTSFTHMSSVIDDLECVDPLRQT